MKRFYASVFLAVAALLALAGTPQEDIVARLSRSAANMALYPDDNLPELTPAPDGYEAFYIDHYGRHGSRWLTRDSAYLRPVFALECARNDSLLTEQGERLLATLRRVSAAAYLRAGELSDRGALQHRRIAQRMYENFPSVFTDDARIDARSTVARRCILTMQNATM